MNSHQHPDSSSSRVGVLLWPTVIAVPGLALLLGLGTWQLERLEWKTALIAEREAHLAAPALALDMSSDPLAIEEFRRVLLRGKFLHEHEIHLLSRTYKGRAGIQVVTPIVPHTGGSEGIAVLVNRGWVPGELSDPDSRLEGQVRGTAEVTGIARTGIGGRGWFVPENRPASGVWHHLNIEEVSQAIGLTLAPFVVEAGPEPNPGGYPIGGQTRIHLRNDHLGYAITWFTLAAALALIYFLFVRQKLLRQPPETS